VLRECLGMGSVVLDSCHDLLTQLGRDDVSHSGLLVPIGATQLHCMAHSVGALNGGVELF